MLCYQTIKNKTCNFFKSLFTVIVSIISEQPSYIESSPVFDSFTLQDLQGQPIYYTDPTVIRNRTFMQPSHSFLLRGHLSRIQRQ